MKEKDRKREVLYDSQSKNLLVLEEKISNDILNQLDAARWGHNLKMVRSFAREIEDIRDMTFVDWKRLYNRVATKINDTLPEESRDRIELIE